jgi:hypothetical protein
MTTCKLLHTTRCSITDELTEIFVCEEFHSPEVFEQMKSYARNHLNMSLASINYDAKSLTKDGKKVNVVSVLSDRKFRKLWHISNEPGYWDQTTKTIYDWGWAAVRKEVHPLIFQHLLKLKNEVEIFKEGNWIPVRGLMNILPNGKTFDGHFDGIVHECDMDKPTTVYSCTYYMDIPTSGGALWSSDRFSFVPEPNSVVIFDGSRMYHGVTAPKDVKPDFVRLAITARFIKAEDLLFPNEQPMLYPPT